MTGSKHSIYLNGDVEQLAQALAAELEMNKSQLFQAALESYADRHGYRLVPAHVEKVKK